MPKKLTYQKITAYEAVKGETKKIVLLYSGSLFTNVLIPWLKNAYKAEVITVTVDLGQKEDFENLKKQAYKYGAQKALIIDAKEEFAKNYITRVIKANASYQGSYHLLTPLSRPLLAKIAVMVAQDEGASAIAHACSGQSNDQMRIDGTILALNPDMKVIAPVREGELTRKSARVLAKEYQIPTEYSNQYYSYDENLWGVSILGGDIENSVLPSRIENLLKLTTTPENAQEVAERVTIDFNQGIPTGINGETMNLVELIQKLNTLGGRHGVGLSYAIEDMILGLKSKSIDEEPAADILISAHHELEKYLCSRMENEFKPIIDHKWTYLCYDGFWYEPLMQDLNVYIDEVNQKVTGAVTVRLYRGTAEVIGIKTPKTIFEKKLATYLDTGVLNQRGAAAYIELRSLSMQLSNRSEKTILLSIGKRTNKFKLLPYLRRLDQTKYRLYATYKTHKFLKSLNIPSIMVNKISQPSLKPNLSDLLEQRRFDLIISIPTSASATLKEKSDTKFILEKAGDADVPLITDLKEAQEILQKLQQS